MHRLRTLLHLATALLLTLQMARGGVDMLVCLHEDSVHLTSAHPDCCGDACADDPTPSDLPALGQDECACLDIPLPGHDHATSAPPSAHAAPDVPLFALPEGAAPVKSNSAAPAPPPSPPCSSSLQPLLRRSVELRI
jgi:hypothetical protein